MNTCEQYQEMISRLVDGEISRDEYAELLAHMNTCSRCNAMYAVFHDLSEILSEENEPLPEGLHENIMASVRRSEMMKRNRRLRSFGLRTALTAVACAVLVLFAASGFGPGKRAESVSIRSEEAAGQLAPTPPAAYDTAEDAVFDLGPANAPVPAVIPTSAPIENFTPAQLTPDPYYLAAGSSVNETAPTPQPEQIFYPEQSLYSAQNNDSAQYVYPEQNVYTWPAVTQTPAPIQTAAPVTVQSTAPAVAATAPPVKTGSTENAPIPQSTAPASVETPVSILESAPAAVGITAPTETGSVEDAPMLRRTPASVESPVPAETGNAETAPILQSAPAAIEITAPTETGSTEDAPILGSAAEPDENPALKDETASRMEEEDAPLFLGDAAPPPDSDSGEVGETVSDDMAATPDSAAVPAPAEKKSAERSIGIRGKEARVKLLALLDGSESALPEEAELTRVEYISLLPDDDYGSAEKLELYIYGDFVYYRSYQQDGGVRTFRAGCALKDLDAFLKPYLEPAALAGALPSAVPTVDPYADEPEKG